MGVPPFMGGGRACLLYIQGIALSSQFVIDSHTLIPGADVDLKTETNATPLLYAAICGNMTVASILVSAGADINQYDMEGNSPIIHAAKYVGHV